MEAVAPQPFTPVGNRVVVRADPADEKKGMIIIPETTQKKPTKGTVVAVGPGLPTRDGTVRIPLQIAAGDRVLYGKWTGAEIKIGDDELIVMPETEVLLILHEDVSGDTV